MTRNQILYWELQEKKRNNRAIEKETNRSNLARETETNRNNNLLFGARMAELAETNRANVAKETQAAINQHEVYRHNIATEGLERSKLNVSMFDAQTRRFSALSSNLNQAIGNLNDSIRNMQNYDISTKSLAETSRHNQALENLESLRLSETSLHNRVTEGETSRHNIATEQETIRSNMAREANDLLRNRITLYDSASSKFITFAKLLANKGVRSGLR